MEGVVAQHEAILLDHAAAARRGHQNRVQPALVDQALPGVDIAPRIVAAFAFAAHVVDQRAAANLPRRSEEHTSEILSLMRIPYAVLCLKNKKYKIQSVRY